MHGNMFVGQIRKTLGHRPTFRRGRPHDVTTKPRHIYKPRRQIRLSAQNIFLCLQIHLLIVCVWLSLRFPVIMSLSYPFHRSLMGGMFDSQSLPTFSPLPGGSTTCPTMLPTIQTWVKLCTVISGVIRTWWMDVDVKSRLGVTWAVSSNTLSTSTL